MPELRRREQSAGEAARMTVEPSADDVRVSLAGVWTLDTRIPSSGELAALLSDGPARRIVLEDGGIGQWDAALVAFAFSTVRMARELGCGVDTDGLPQGARDLLALATSSSPGGDGRDDGRAGALFPALGALRAELAATLSFVGELTLSFGRLAVGRARFRRTDLTDLLREAGFDALPVVSLISFLVGSILAFVGAVQLQNFGAQIFVADLVGIAMVRDIGAMMAAIIIAGRTGASFAARIGTMQGNEEIDALRTMGVEPMDFLVLPRVLALILMAPFLVVYADVMGMLGGAVVGTGLPGVTLTQYVNRSSEALTLGGFVGGVFKGTVYASLVAIAGCMRGMQCGRSAAAVGSATTSAVVTGIVYVVAAAALLTLVFHVLGI
jgi:phospholipid/cholesterol/gamma-HCH transport system permease protein